MYHHNITVMLHIYCRSIMVSLYIDPCNHNSVELWCSNMIKGFFFLWWIYMIVTDDVIWILITNLAYFFLSSLWYTRIAEPKDPFPICSMTSYWSILDSMSMMREGSLKVSKCRSSRFKIQVTEMYCYIKYRKELKRGKALLLISFFFPFLIQPFF